MVPPPVYLMSYLVNYSNNNNCSGVELTLKTTFECHNYYGSSSFLDCCEENVNRNMGSIAINECINSNFKNYSHMLVWCDYNIKDISPNQLGIFLGLGLILWLILTAIILRYYCKDNDNLTKNKYKNLNTKTTKYKSIQTTEIN
mgnify:FL=1